MNKARSKNLFNNIKEKELIYDFPLSKISSMGVGGIARVYIVVDSKKELVNLLSICMEKSLNFKIIGSGTNTIFNDGFIDMVIIRLGKEFNYFDFVNAEVIRAGSAFNLLKFIIKSAAGGCDYSELAGIPGTIGGAIMGNSGSNEKSICDYTKKINYLSSNKETLEEKIVNINRTHYGYRHFNIKDLLVITDIEFNLPETIDRDCRDILTKIREKIKNKKVSQPVGVKNSGCFFKNPVNTDRSAGELIDSCSLKGFSYGGAKVSEKHANFIVNYSNACAADIFVLSRLIKKKVFEKYGIDLDYEVEMIGF